MNEQETLLAHAQIEELISKKSGNHLVKKMSSKSFVVSSYFAECCDRYYFDFSWTISKVGSNMIRNLMPGTSEYGSIPK